MLATDEDPGIAGHVARHGWVRMSGLLPDDLRLLLSRFGRVEAPGVLTATDTARSRTLSGAHGRGTFPFHTDGAAEHRPPSYVALWSPEHYETATLLIDGEDHALALPVLERCWVVTPGGRRCPFYAIPRVVRDSRVNWRFNQDCMSPAGQVDALPGASALFSSVPSIRIEWNKADAIIFDNRRMLHSREAISPRDESRTLLRLRVYDGLVI